MRNDARCWLRLAAGVGEVFFGAFNFVGFEFCYSATRDDVSSLDTSEGLRDDCVVACDHVALWFSGRLRDYEVWVHSAWDGLGVDVWF